MLESLRLWPHIRARLEAGPLGPYLISYITLLTSEGYTRCMIRRHVRAIDAFGAWLRRRRITVEGIDLAALDRFARAYPRRRCSSRPCGRIPEVVGSVRKFATFLWAIGAAECLKTPPPTEADLLLRSFDKHLDSVKGLAPGTRSRYLRYAGLFLETKFGSATPDWSRVGVGDIVDFVREQAARLKPTACRSTGNRHPGIATVSRVDGGGQGRARRRDSGGSGVEALVAADLPVGRRRGARACRPWRRDRVPPQGPRDSPVARPSGPARLGSGGTGPRQRRLAARACRDLGRQDRHGPRAPSAW